LRTAEEDLKNAIAGSTLRARILMAGEECAPCGCHLIETKPAATKGTIPTCTLEHKRRDEKISRNLKSRHNVVAFKTNERSVLPSQGFRC